LILTCDDDIFLFGDQGEEGGIEGREDPLMIMRFLHIVKNFQLDYIPVGMEEVDSETIQSMGCIFLHLHDRSVHLLKSDWVHE